MGVQVSGLWTSDGNYDLERKGGELLPGTVQSVKELVAMVVLVSLLYWHTTLLPTYSEINVNIKGTCLKSGGLFYRLALLPTSLVALRKSLYLWEPCFYFSSAQRAFGIDQGL